MDEINYRRLTTKRKIRCPDCGATSYEDPDGRFRCVVCNHEMFETCLDCGHLTGWCECPPAPVAVKAERRVRASKSRK